jgi:hypothetical protein
MESLNAVRRASILIRVACEKMWYPKGLEAGTMHRNIRAATVAVTFAVSLLQGADNLRIAKIGYGDSITKFTPCADAAGK